MQFGGARLLAPALASYYERLVAAGVEPLLAQRILGTSRCRLRAGPRRRPGRWARSWPTPSPARSRAAPRRAAGATRVALVGPPGAGKTASLAKLAARAEIEGGRAGIIDLDGGGLGQTSPLEAFASIAGIPYVAALTPDDLAQQLRRTPADSSR